MRIVRQSLVEFQNYRANPAQYDEPDKTFLIVSLDLLSGLTQGLNTSITELYQASDPPVLNLLAICLQVRCSPALNEQRLTGNTAPSPSRPPILVRPPR